ncbi:MAG: phosphonoacetaldehyde hydrolase [Naasia sp.]|nr:phosphonoacetaldehyde hydrolase [Naasia sp.]
MTAKPRPIVAELGRPETPEETAARQAQARATRRSRQTTTNLVLSLGASLAVLAALILLVPRGEQEFAPDIDYAATAQEAQGAVDVPLAVPDLSDAWTANAAELRTGAADGVDSWYIGFVTPGRQYAGFSQGIDANESWLADLLDSSRADTTTRIDGLQWTVYDNRDADRDGNVDYALATEADEGVLAVYGTADPAELEELAAAIAADLGASR